MQLVALINNIQIFSSAHIKDGQCRLKKCTISLTVYPQLPPWGCHSLDTFSELINMLRLSHLNKTKFLQ